MIKGQKIELKVNTYKRWVEQQNIPVIKEYYIEDLKRPRSANGRSKAARARS